MSAPGAHSSKYGNRVYNHFVENKHVFTKQFGFQISTLNKHAILLLERNITKSFEINEYVLGVFIDLKKKHLTQ